MGHLVCDPCTIEHLNCYISYRLSSVRAHQVLKANQSYFECEALFQHCKPVCSNSKKGASTFCKPNLSSIAHVPYRFLNEKLALFR
jgi:hypothetical protein